MKFIIFVFGIVIGAAGAFGTIAYWEMQKRNQEEQLVFAPKNFYDSKGTGASGLVAISGTLTGKGLGYPNNTYAVSCYDGYKTRVSCPT
jgi:hypothetical protein